MKPGSAAAKSNMMRESSVVNSILGQYTLSQEFIPRSAVCSLYLYSKLYLYFMRNGIGFGYTVPLCYMLLTPFHDNGFAEF